ncbi:BTAD domain-containing putative transcriptional regulator [Streptomyces sp. MI02-7b]|uniref:BTAD domain-containing putative transcriptional regulator n=1 Tax=Streptomyces sp. MI02-7b TaxID=462941 RepID=UPI0029AFFE01|nr:BTAD domain-containing putative transcriptional regulator [Streptomyces sp. MI02-7b]MDX3076657.1 BTAD domain-containing putative transcriptional regulator [Streptomyces sp. MI02-7b]
MERVAFGVLGPVVAESGDGPLALKGPRHRAVLARLIVARRRVVPVARLVEDLWADPPPGAVGAVQTFVGALRHALEPDRPRRAPSRLLVTEGPGYALRPESDAVDAWRFEAAVAVAAGLPAERALPRLEDALGLWRGPAYAEFADEHWARAERARLGELRLQAEERRAGALLALGRAAEAVPGLEVLLSGHPLREEARRLLALALYRQGRQGDALAALREARSVLTDRLGVDPGPALRRLEADILAHAPGLDLPAEPAATAARLWTRAAAAYDRTVATGARARLEATVGLIRNLAVTGGGGLEEAQRHRLEAVTAAEEFGDPELTARVIGAYDVPAIWTRSDDPELARRIVAAAERALAALPPPGGSQDAARCRLLATIALETRGVRSPRGPEAAREAEGIARRLDDPALLAFALNAGFMQSCTRAGLAPRRDAIGAELVELAARHGLVTYEVLGHLIRLQARSALADFAAADRHAAATDALAERHELPLAGVFTQWYRAMRLAAHGRPGQAATAYRAAAARLHGAGMPGLERGLLPLALLSLRLTPEEPLSTAPVAIDPGLDWGPFRPWTEPFALLADGRPAAAREALHALPEPPPDLLYEVCCVLESHVALRLGDRAGLQRAHDRLLPAAGELVVGGGLFTLGPLSGHLGRMAEALRTPIRREG